MSASQELVRELLAGGLSRRAIGQAIGRNDRLIGYVERGQKPGANLEGALRELRDKLAGGAPAAELRAPVTAAPARRTTAAGQTARVRMSGVVQLRHSMTGVAKEQAARNGARGLGGMVDEADARGQKLAATLVLRVGSPVRQEAMSGRRGRRAAATGTATLPPTLAGRRKPRRRAAEVVELGNIDAETLRGLVDEHGGNVTAALLAYGAETGALSGVAEDAETGVLGVELRAY